MVMDSTNLIAQNQANRDFGKVARYADSNGYTVIMKYNEPKYLVLRVDKVEDALRKLGFYVNTSPE